MSLTFYKTLIFNAGVAILTSFSNELFISLSHLNLFSLFDEENFLSRIRYFFLANN